MPPLPPIPGSTGPGVIRGPAARLGAAFGGALGADFFAAGFAADFVGGLLFISLPFTFVIGAKTAQTIFLDRDTTARVVPVQAAGGCRDVDFFHITFDDEWIFLL